MPNASYKTCFLSPIEKRYLKKLLLFLISDLKVTILDSSIFTESAMTFSVKLSAIFRLDFLGWVAEKMFIFLHLCVDKVNAEMQKSAFETVLSENFLSLLFTTSQIK